MKLKHVAITTTVALLSFLPSLALAAVTYRVLHNFDSGKDGGGVPSGPLFLGGREDLYGNTSIMVFELSPQAGGPWKESILHTFTGGGGGAYPWGNLLFDSYGNLYGTMSGYGSYAIGGVFELSPASEGGWAFDVIYSQGAGPGLLADKAGNLYGAIGPGDYHGAGAIGELSLGSGERTYSQLYSFCGPDGCPDGLGPEAPPTWDGKGNMFGTAIEGGIGQPACWISLGCGVIFEMTPNGNDTWTYHVLHRFASSKSDGQSPSGGLVMDKSGNFYGTTDLGGTKGNGTVFELAHISGHWKLTQIYDFPNCKLGCLPGGTLTFDKVGNLYGVASGGLPDCGYTCGVVFKLSLQTTGKWKYSVLHKFTGPDGAFPGYGLVIDDQGNLFGVTSSGGKFNFGVAFEIAQ
jgi:hypothetical protein